MGRTRRIMKDAILDAAERVVIRLGAAGLSIDAVAQEAGVSKSTVLYDHKSKGALLEALIDRQMEEEKARISAAVCENAGTLHPELFGRIAVAQRTLSDTDKAVALAICTSMGSHEKLTNDMRDWTAADIKAMSEGEKPRAALMAYLALSGFYCTELFGFHTWSETERDEILESIRAIYTSYSEPT